MKSLQTLSGIGAIAVLTIAAGCSSWNWDRTAQSDRNATVGSASSTAPSRDTTNSAGAKTPPQIAPPQIALPSESQSTNPPSTYASSQSVLSGSPSYRREAVASATTVTANMNANPGASTSGMNAATNAAPPSYIAENRTEASFRGATNDRSLVRSAQQALNDQGYNAGTVDGIAGPHTKAAVRKFQSAKGIRATGELDSATIAALGVTQPSSSSTTGMNSNTPERISKSGAMPSRY